MSDGFLNALYIVPILALLILVHEFGHFFAAHAVGAKVEEFGIGIPPRIKGWMYKDVLWSLNWIPFGGFVRVLGEDGKNMDSGSMNAKSPGQRAFFLAAGSAMNLLLAVVLTIPIVATQGVPTGNVEVYIGAVAPNSPAAGAGWKVGDRIAEIGGVTVDEGNDVSDLTREFAGRPMQVVLDRDGERMVTTVTPRESPPANEGPTGVTLAQQALFRSVPPLEVIPTAVVETGSQLRQLLEGIVALLTGQAPLSQVAGPIGMGQITSELVSATTLAVWVTLTQLTVLLSLNLALLNLLPLPALDGGRLFFVLVEVLRGGKRVPPEREGVVHLAGMIILIGLMFFVAFLDVGRLIDGEALLP